MSDLTQTHTTKPKLILFPCDASAASLAAFEHLPKLAQSLQAEVCLLADYALEAAVSYDFSQLEQDTPELSFEGSLTELEHAFKQILSQRLEIQAQALRSQGIRVRTRLSRGQAGEVIVRTAKQLKCDMIIIGSRGLDALEARQLGSTSEYVLLHCPCPVLIMPYQPNKTASCLN